MEQETKTKLNKLFYAIAIIGTKLMMCFAFAHSLVLFTGTKWFYLTIICFWAYDDIISLLEQQNNPMGDLQKIMEKLK